MTYQIWKTQAENGKGLYKKGGLKKSRLRPVRDFSPGEITLRVFELR